VFQLFGLRLKCTDAAKRHQAEHDSAVIAKLYHETCQTGGDAQLSRGPG